jgi:hypothetical protein
VNLRTEQKLNCSLDVVNRTNSKKNPNIQMLNMECWDKNPTPGASVTNVRTLLHIKFGSDFLAT